MNGEMKVFVSWDGDHIGREAGRARLSDDVAKVRQVDFAIRAGNDLWTAMALRCGGETIEAGGDEGAISVPAQSLSEVQTIQRQYTEVVGATCTVGVGMKMSESSKALMVGKLRGGNGLIVVWDEEMQKELDAAAPQSESDKIGEAYLGKADVQGGAGPAPAPPQQPQKQPHVQLPEQPQPVDPVSQIHALEAQMHDMATAQGQQDEQDQVGEESHLDEVRAQVAQTLTAVRDQMPLIQQLQEAAPEVYASIMALVQGLIALGREVAGVDPEAAEAAPGDMPPAQVAATPAQKAEPSASNPRLMPHLDTPANTVPANVVPQNPQNPHTGTAAHRGGGTTAGRAHIKLPVGSTLDGKIKIRHADGAAGWKNMLAGMISGFEASPLFGANSFPVSSRQPGKQQG
jgi:hypothetical protein